MDKQIDQMKKLKAAAYLDTKDEGKTKSILCFYLQKRREKKNNIPADAGHFLKTEIDSTDLKNQNLTTKIRRKKEEKPYFFKNMFQKIFTQMTP